jgi:processive 1,2-diacylglycerol beta-glucosyltransferase
MISILVVHASFGDGHRRAAEAVGESLKVPVYDLLDFTFAPLRYAYREGYLFITRHLPSLWRFIFWVTKINLFSKSAHFSHQFLVSRFLRFIKDKNPDLIITTHFSASHIIAMNRKSIKSPLITIVTDIRAHPLWVDESIARYFVFSDLTKKDLIEAGADANKIISGYAALRSGFLPEADLDSLYSKFSLPRRPVILFTCANSGKPPYLASTLSLLLKDFNVIVIHGNNKKIKKILDAKACENLKHFPFYESMWELISLASVIVCKPGGLTVFEGIFKKKPFVFTHLIPGQEDQNMNFLSRYDVSRFVRNEKEFLEAVYYFYNKFTKNKAPYPVDLDDIRKPLLEITKDISSLNS